MSQEEKSKKPFNAAWYLVIAAAAFIAIIVVFFEFVLQSPVVPFSTFKSNFAAADNVSIVVEFSNNTQTAYETNCFNDLAYVVHSSYSKHVNQFYIYNYNSTCEYSPTLYPVNITTKPESYCLNIANGEPSIILSYSNANSTTITARQLQIAGNNNYMQMCPIAAEIS